MPSMGAGWAIIGREVHYRTLSTTTHRTTTSRWIACFEMRGTIQERLAGED